MNHTTYQTQRIKLGIKKRGITLFLSGIAAILRGLNYCASFFRSTDALQKVIIVEPFGLGDAISLEPLVRCLAANRYDVAICAKREWRALYPQVYWIDSIVPWSATSIKTKYELKRYFSMEFFRFLKELREKSLDGIGLDTRGDVRSLLLLHLAGCRRVLTLSTYLGSDLQIPAWAAELVAFSKHHRRWENNLFFARRMNLICEPSSPVFAKTPLKQTQGKRIVIVPVAPWEGKLWRTEKWGALIRSLQIDQWDVRALCGPNQVSATNNEIGGGVSVHECDSIPKWIEELSQADIAITLDTGPMHLADALGIPVVALFGQGLLPLWAPSGNRSCILSHQDDPDFVLCHPIDENTDHGRTFMDRITVAEVLNAVAKIAA